MRLAESGQRRGVAADSESGRAGADLHDLPNLDMGLAAVTRTYRLPGDAPVLLFALGRTIGWIAHAIEEYATGQVIRPRARYVGPPPSDAEPAFTTKGSRS